ncbi:hypothetical protein MMC20_004348 [Loxospora ochrophaea]|nr:hypothetical protein [Loxospora ochrophaea]
MLDADIDTESRSLTIDNKDPDLVALGQNHFVPQVAKSVFSNGQLTYNMVWNSLVLAPIMNVKWKPIYGLNWTADVPTPGLAITLGGRWKQCDQGQVLDLNELGIWAQSTITPSPGYLKVGVNKYQTQTGSNGVHFIVGVQEAPGKFSSIFIDQNETGHGMTATYQPQEQVQRWFEAGVKSSTMISEINSIKETGDFFAKDSISGTFSKTSSYNFKNSVWTTTAP